MKARIIERTIKDGNNQIIKYTIKGCETEKVNVNSSGYYVFGDKSFSKGVQMKFFMLILCAIILGITSTVWLLFGGYHNGINVITYTILTVSFLLMVLDDQLLIK